jgi:(p)ppGpp synthase/HD superfamily hydrolase
MHNHLQNPFWRLFEMTDAMMLAERLHRGQTDKSGAPYYRHLEAVAGILHRDWVPVPPHVTEAAWLHDSLEDTPATPDGLLEAGVAPEAVSLIQQLTRPTGTLYADYIADLAANGDIWAIRIKLADNEHNSDPARRLPDIDLVERRYLPARVALEAAHTARCSRTKTP